MNDTTRLQNLVVTVAIVIVIWAHVTVSSVILFSIVLLVLALTVQYSARISRYAHGVVPGIVPGIAPDFVRAIPVGNGFDSVNKDLRGLEAELHSQIDQHRTDAAEFAQRELEFNKRFRGRQQA